MNWKCLGLAFVWAVVSAASANAKTIAISFTDLDPYLTGLRDAIVVEAKKIDGMQVDFSDAKKDAALQFTQVESMLAKHPDALIIFCEDGATAMKVNDATAAAGIPVVYLLAIPPADKHYVKSSFVSSNGYVAGRLQMRKLAALMGGQGNLVILRGVDSSTDTKGRTQGVKEIAQKFPNIHIIEDASAGWGRAPAEKVITDWLAKGDKIDAIAANNDEMALGAIDALEKAKLTKVLVAGVDGSTGGLVEMRKGRMTLTVLQNATAQGARAVHDAMILMDGKSAQQYDWVPFELVTQDDLASYATK